MSEFQTSVLLMLLGTWLAFLFDRQKRREEAEFRLKQEALIQAADAIHRFLAYYLSIPDRPFPQDGNTEPEVVESGISLNKLHFYCSLKTIECAVRVGNLFGAATIEAVKAKMPSAFLAEDVKVLDMQIAGYEATNARLQQEIELLLQSDPNNPLIAHYKHQKAETFRLIAECHGRKSELAKERYVEIEKCRDVVFKNLMPLSEASRDLLLMARDELKFNIDRKKYHALMNRVADEGQQRLTDFMNTVREEANKRMQ